MGPSRSPSLRNLLLVVAALAAVWSGAVQISGGFLLEPGGVRLLSARGARNPALIALLGGLAAWVLSSRADRARVAGVAARLLTSGARRAHALLARSAPARAARALGPSAPRACALIAAVGVAALGLARGTFVASGADAHGYISQADLWARGSLRVEQPFVPDPRSPITPAALAPLGYRPVPDGSVMVPVYPPGLPMLMAAADALSPGRARFWVVPMLGGVAVWATYLLGARLAGPAAGLSAAVLLATSPPFLLHVIYPMSDVPATAWWALAWAALLRGTRGAAAFAGLAAGAAIAIRPNLAPLAAVPSVFLIWRGLAGADRGDAPARRRLGAPLAFWAGMAPGCAIILGVNAHLYGSPIASGYGPLDPLFGWANLAPNLDRYPRWLLEAQTPIVLLAIAAPFVARAWTSRVAHARAFAVASWCFVAAVFAAYLFHVPIDTWASLRYLLPAVPLLLALAAAVLAHALARLDRGVRALVLIATVGAVAWHGLAFTRDRGVFEFRVPERRVPALGAYITEHLPARSAFIALHHSGSIRYYSGRLTVRYDQVAPDALDETIGALRRAGYHPYVALDDWEVPAFRARFGAHGGLAALEGEPLVSLDFPTRAMIYDAVP